MSLIVDDIHKSYGRHPALAGASLSMADGEFLSLLGPSGSGKTTLLRILAGLDRPDTGRVRLDGADLVAVGARRRRVGLVFQHYALFRHMTVADNIAFGLDVRPAKTRPPRLAIRARVAKLMALTRIDGLADRYPAQLSGGQRQRVALARALAVEPRLLLLDEPFGALDAKVRKELRVELRRIHDRTGVTTLFVTHDQDEAMALGDRVALMHHGRIEQIGSRRELDAAPASAFVFEFLGDCNRLPCELVDGIARFDGFTATDIAPPGRRGKGVALFRSAETRLILGEESGEGLPVRVAAVAGRGALRRVECQTDDGQRVAAEVTEAVAGDLRPGQAGRLKLARVFVDMPSC